MSNSLIFFGSDQYSAVVLADLIQNPSIQILGVVTDQASSPTPVENLAHAHHLPIYHYPSLPPVLPQGTMGLCASFDHLLEELTIDKFKGLLFNLHPSLLPQYRNVSPVQYSLAMGDQLTGLTLFRLSPGIDNGEILGQITEPILQDDTTPILTARLFSHGVALLLAHLEGKRPSLALPTHPLIFTKRLTRNSGYLEWEILQFLLKQQTFSVEETTNELLRLRLTHNPQGDILSDLLRALTPWPGIWSLAQTKKGELRVSLESVIPEITLKLAGKPKAITWHDFTRYYL